MSRTADPTTTAGQVPSQPGDPEPPALTVQSVAASDLVAACEQAWSAIQARHPKVPDAVIVLGTGVERGRLVKLGHWWGGQWRVGTEERSEVLLAGEALHLPAEAVFEVLLHEAAHGLNAATGVRDTSRGGRYHNANFRAAAREVGLKACRMDPYGWARTVLTPAAATEYVSAIAGIHAEMRLVRGLPAERGVEGGTGGVGVEGGDGGTAAGDGRPRRPAAECGCRPGRKLRMSPSVLARGAVFCGLCGSEFSFPHQVERRIPDAMAQAARQEELSQGVVDGSFVARRRLALDHDPSADASGPALAHLARLGAAIDAVAADLPDGRLMQQVFADTRAEIVAWIESRSAEVINLHPHRRGEERRSPVEADVVADLDLRTVELAGSPLEPQLSVTSQPVPVREADPVGPDRSIPEVP